MSETIDRARRSLESELKRAEAHVVKVRRALAAMSALNGRGEGKKNMSRKHLITCGCGTKFHAVRSDARFCLECRKERHRIGESKRTKARPKKSRGVTLSKNTPTA